jgi:hypothetical protein
MKTKPQTFKNSFNHEVWICDDPKKVKIIDNVTYITVRRPDSQRTVMMRRDSLQPYKQS